MNYDAGGLALWDRLKKREDGPLGVGDAPSEQLAIEILGGGLVGGGQFDPAESAGRILIDV